MFRMAVGFQSLTLLLVTTAVAWCQSGDQFIVHDAEFYVLKAQNAAKWAAEDRTLDVRLAELREKHGGPRTSCTSCGTTRRSVTWEFRIYKRYVGSRLRG